ncbi:lasso peptide biosynthesis B2 protein [Cohnella rhizosphaerae]|uniref:Lasso peptide biosynthesis B2 protein n=1 Tax=Cohnella rhizosphaerae TaxID=1457232 RepID=A0A9X4L0Q8_9BACL|nr:lasso peptide biosynthesis B2 protein [Cohnella rhizosphaerae]MDG0814413.1 lasso peptide biosynthesis B2 protein [Cohnella rhizosphaerae]
MNALRRVARIASTDSLDRRMFLEALAYLTWARLLLLLPFHKYARFLGQPMTETAQDTEPGSRESASRVSSAIRRAGRLTPLDTRCLVRAIAAMKMLQRREVETTLYLGTAKDKDGRMIAHAWLRCGNQYVTGAEEMRGFTVVGKFARHTFQRNMRDRNGSNR